MTRVVYLVICGAGPASDATKFIKAAHAEGWDCHVITTPTGSTFVDIEALESASGHPVISEHRSPGTPRRGRPPADTVVVAPATTNTICKLAAGISDTYALDIVSEYIGFGVPVVVVPFVNSALANRASYRKAVSALKAEEVAVYDVPAHLPHQGAAHLESFPWSGALAMSTTMASKQSR